MWRQSVTSLPSETSAEPRQAHQSKDIDRLQSREGLGVWQELPGPRSKTVCPFQGPIDFSTCGKPCAAMWQRKHLGKKDNRMQFRTLHSTIQLCIIILYIKNAPWISTSLWASSLVALVFSLPCLAFDFVIPYLPLLKNTTQKIHHTGTPEHQSRNTL